jgi:hypothetical protein
MATSTDIVKKQLVYWVRVSPVTAAGLNSLCISEQAGMAPVTCTHVVGSGIYVFLLGTAGFQNFSVPINRRQVVLSIDGVAASVGITAQYDSTNAGAPLDNTVRILTFTGAGPAVLADQAFTMALYRIETQLGSAAAPAG